MRRVSLFLFHGNGHARYIKIQLHPLILTLQFLIKLEPMLITLLILEIALLHLLIDHMRKANIIDSQFIGALALGYVEMNAVYKELMDEDQFIDLFGLGFVKDFSVNG